MGQATIQWLEQEVVGRTIIKYGERPTIDNEDREWFVGIHWAETGVTTEIKVRSITRAIGLYRELIVKGGV